MTVPDYRFPRYLPTIFRDIAIVVFVLAVLFILPLLKSCADFAFRTELEGDAFFATQHLDPDGWNSIHLSPSRRNSDILDSYIAYGRILHPRDAVSREALKCTEFSDSKDSIEIGMHWRYRFTESNILFLHKDGSPMGICDLPPGQCTEISLSFLLDHKVIGYLDPESVPSIGMEICPRSDLRSLPDFQD